MKRNFWGTPALRLYVVIIVICLVGSITSVAQSHQSSVTPQQILDAHNKFRSEVGIPDLKWSGELASYAQKWANELAFKKGCKMQHRPHDAKDRWNEKYGENIYWAGGSNWKPTILDAVQQWGMEKSNFDIDTKDCKSGKVCGHYTQMIWEKSTMVGCGIALCPGGYTIVVCNYNPPGNYAGEKAY